MNAILWPVVLLWAQLFVALVPTWQHGEYYQYGWFVPPLAVLLACRRWRELRTEPRFQSMPADSTRLPVNVAVICAAAVLLIIPLRVIGSSDPGWRPPLLLHVAIVTALSHLLVARAYGRRFSLAMLPVTLFALSAVPYPWQLERTIIGTLTSTVLTVTREIFLLAGNPVELIGERLAMNSDAVSVTDGCSGIRSLQSLVMVALFFGEWLWLAWPSRLALILTAAACAIGVNALRALTLAHIHFTRGEAAAAAAHDLTGHAAFALSAAILWLTAWSMLHLSSPRHPILRSVQESGVRSLKSEI